MCETGAIRSLIPVSLVKRWPISASFLSEYGAKLFQQRYEISRCWPRAGGMRVARIPARPPPVVARKRRRLKDFMTPPWLSECRHAAGAVKARRDSGVIGLADRAWEPLLRAPRGRRRRGASR